MTDTLLVSEVFGPTIQGEGPSCGRQAYFLRLGGCNQHCVWCDTPYTWDWTGRNGVVYVREQELRKMSFSEIVVGALSPLQFNPRPILVITGGEPMLQAIGVQQFIDYATERHFPLNRVEIETAGTVWFDFQDERVFYNVSPKLENSGNERALRYQPRVLEQFLHSLRAVFKFVVRSNSDLEEVDAIVGALSIPVGLVWIMPEGIDKGTLAGRLQQIGQQVIERGYNISPRLQIEIWGNRRGV